MGPDHPLSFVFSPNNLYVTSSTDSGGFSQIILETGAYSICLGVPIRGHQFGDRLTLFDRHQRIGCFIFTALECLDLTSFKAQNSLSLRLKAPPGFCMLL